MPSLKDIRRRITSVKKTQQITRAMRMVAAAKLRRAQEAIESARPYAERMRETLVEVAASQGAEHPLLATRETVKNVDVVVISSDRGLCGAFNSNVLKRAEQEIAARDRTAERLAIATIGRKASEFFGRRRREQIVRSITTIARIDYAHAQQIAAALAQRFLSGESDEVWLVHSEFISTITQRPRVVKLLPLAPEPSQAATDKPPFTIEPSAEKLLALLVPKALEVEIFRALLDNQAGEHAARMTAMESATRNSEDMISRLTLQYNRARQAAITKELVEIVSGAEAL
ncbi:MAG: ATP synthase F1 subunit gamma [Myxococcota bacterium]|jgi:F-type H+-transporting ATPase subunit gamma|nr:ATP synthase F1 subunit gamma [Myxococcota bacterium]